MVSSCLVYQNSNYSVPTIRDTVHHLKESRVGDGKARGKRGPERAERKANMI